MPAKPGRRLICLIYGALLIVAVVIAAAIPVVMLTAGLSAVVARTALQAFLIVICGVYFVWQWTRTGQTLAMKTWRLKLVTQSGEPLTPARAAARYLLALAGIFAGGAGFLWALVDRERKFLHDRIAGTTIVNNE